MLKADLQSYDWDWEEEPLAVLTATQVLGVLDRLESGEVASDDVISWANLLECRDDVEFGPLTASAIFNIANPELQGALHDILPSLRKQLLGPSASN